MNDVFVKMNPGEPHMCEKQRILVKGRPGTGKTTMINKMAYDWATHKNTISELNSFVLLFVVRGSELSQDESILEHIMRTYALKSLLSIDVLKKIITKNKTLLLFDAYDEQNHEGNKMKEFLKPETFKLVTVVLTSRPGKTINIEDDFDIEFNIEALRDSDIEMFLKKYSEISDTKIIDIDLKGYALRPLLKIPLFLWFFVILGEKTFENVDLSKRTILYKAIMDAMVKRTIHKGKGSLTKEEASIARREICGVAYKCLCNDDAHYKGDISKNAASFGFVTSSRKLTDLCDGITVYQFTHKSIYEYLAAEHVANQDPDHIVNMMRSVPECEDVGRKRSSLFQFFVCGLVKKQQNIILNIFSKLVPEDKVNFSGYTLECIAEIGWFEKLRELWPTRVSNDIHLQLQDYAIYKQKGLQYLLNGDYKLKKLTVACANIDIADDVSVIVDLIKQSEWNKLHIVGDGDIAKLAKQSTKIVFDDIRFERLAYS